MLEISQADDGLHCYACYLDDEKQIVQAISNEMKNMADDLSETYTSELDFPYVTCTMSGGFIYTFQIISASPLSKETMKQLEKTFPNES